MTSTEKRVAEREALRSVIQQWNANRLDLFELSEPDEVKHFICTQSVFIPFYYNLIKFSCIFHFRFQFPALSPQSTESTIPWCDAILFPRSWSKSGDKVH